MTLDPPPLLVRVTRDGVTESVHRGHVAAVTSDGAALGAIGDPTAPVYPRSCLKPFQAAAALELLDADGATLPLEALAVSAASHTGSLDHQIEVAHLLALGGLDETVLRCPADYPLDRVAHRHQDDPSPLAHNCSGKHAVLVCAAAASGHDTAGYLDPLHPVQRHVRARVEHWCAAHAQGPGIDGCGAPAWRLPLEALARGFAGLREAESGAAQRVVTAMSRLPVLAGGDRRPDTDLMRADSRVLAKTGAEGVFCAALLSERGALGVAVKVADGGGRAASVAAAAVLAAAGARTPDAVLRPEVMGGGAPHGAIEADPSLLAAVNSWELRDCLQ